MIIFLSRTGVAAQRRQVPVSSSALWQSEPKANTVQLSYGSLVQHAAEGRMDAPFTCEWHACQCYPTSTDILN